MRKELTDQYGNRIYFKIEKIDDGLSTSTVATIDYIQRGILRYLCIPDYIWHMGRRIEVYGSTNEDIIDYTVLNISNMNDLEVLQVPACFDRIELKDNLNLRKLQFIRGVSYATTDDYDYCVDLCPDHEFKSWIESIDVIGCPMLSGVIVPDDNSFEEVRDVVEKSIGKNAWKGKECEVQIGMVGSGETLVRFDNGVLIFEEGVKEINEDIWYHPDVNPWLDDIVEVRLSSTIHSIEDDFIRSAMKNCRKLSLGTNGMFFDELMDDDQIEEITVDEENPWYASVDGVLYSKNMSCLCRYPVGKRDRHYEVHPDVKTINYQAFTETKYLESLVLPDGLSSIEENAFENCFSLKELNFPSSLTFINDYAFVNCWSLEEVVLHGNVELGWYVFCNCRSLRKVVFPPHLKIIERGVLESCTNIEEVVLPKELEGIGDRDLSYSKKLLTVHLPKNIEYVNPFGLPDSLKTITVSEENEYFFSEDGILYDKKTGDIELVPWDHD